MSTQLCPHCGYPLDRLAIEQQFTGYSYFPVQRIDDGALVIDWDTPEEDPDVSFVPNSRRIIHLDCLSFIEQATLDANGELLIHAHASTQDSERLAAELRPARVRRGVARKRLRVRGEVTMPRRAARLRTANSPVGRTLTAHSAADSPGSRRGRRSEDSIAA